MTSTQKATIALATLVPLAAAIHEARRASALASEVHALTEQRASLAAQIEQLQRGHESAEPQRPGAGSNNRGASADASELLRLRGEVGLLRRQLASMKTTPDATTNQIQFTPLYQPYLRREEWSDRGTDKPLNMIQTMLSAMARGDEARLEQMVSRVRES